MTGDGSANSGARRHRLANVLVVVLLAATIALFAWLYREVGGRRWWDTPPNRVTCELMRRAPQHDLDDALARLLDADSGSGESRFDGVALPSCFVTPPGQRRWD